MFAAAAVDADNSASLLGTRTERSGSRAEQGSCAVGRRARRDREVTERDGGTTGSSVSGYNEPTILRAVQHSDGRRGYRAVRVLIYILVI